MTNRKTRFSRTAIVYLVILVGALFITSAGFVYARAPLDNSFTYHGFLTDGGTPPTRSYEFEFKLFDSETAGAQIGGTEDAEVMVNDGNFVVELDFGSDAFDGNARWLEIALRKVGDSDFTTVTPRVKVTLSPYALFAKKLGLPFSGLSDCMDAIACGPTFKITNAGTNQAGKFEITNAANSSTALEVKTDGEGSAGLFAIENVENDGFALVARTQGADGKGVFGYASDSGGLTTGIHGEVESPIGKGVYGKNRVLNSEGYLGGIVGVYGFSEGGTGIVGRSNSGKAGEFAGRVEVTADRCCNGGDLSHHVVVLRNNSSDKDPDVLALKVHKDNPDQFINYITFFDQDGTIGEMEGNGKGGVTLNTPSSDFAEYLPKLDISESFSSGEIVGLVGGKVGKQTSNAERIMVVTTAPIILGNAPDASSKEQYAPIAFLGQVPTKVSGPVQAGDYILPSGKQDGTGIAISPEALTLNQFPQVVGRALETSDTRELKQVNVMVGLGHAQLWHQVLQQQDEQLAGLMERIAILEVQLSQLVTTQ
ncbi:MAG: hypothetical protein AAF702_27720 [Chloroflexota bacterium]